MEPLFKVGDKVKIKKLDYSQSADYKYGLNPQMCALSGKEVIIKECEKDYLTDKKVIPDDNALYKIEGSQYSWASSMFNRISDSSVTLNAKRKIKLNFKV